jgi:hypothetical protein
MNVLRTLRVLLTGLVRRPALAAHTERTRPNLPRQVRTRRGVPFTFLLFAALVLAANGAAWYLLTDPQVRDPEYGRRSVQLHARLRENPGRPLVLVVGSSRTAMGVRPAEWEAIRPNNPAHPDPMIFNMAILGSGPMMELMALRRAYADGIRPAVVLLEYWPPFFHYEDGWAEPNRVAVGRLMDCDRELVRNYFPAPDLIEQEMNWRRTSPLFANRERLLNLIAPTWLPPLRRADAGWTGLDAWGWLPGFDPNPEDTDRRRQAVANCSNIYRPVFAKYRISPIADRAMREAVALAREHGAVVGFLYLPESSEFRALYPANVQQLASEHLAAMSRGLNVPVLDCRTWMPDSSIVDGFHLSGAGSAEFTRKLGPAVAAMFGGDAK